MYNVIYLGMFRLTNMGIAVFNTVLPFLLKKRNNFKAIRMACYIAKKNGKIVNLVIKSYLKTLNL